MNKMHFELLVKNKKYSVAWPLKKTKNGFLVLKNVYHLATLSPSTLPVFRFEGILIQVGPHSGKILF
jgi:hypothetical protein